MGWAIIGFVGIAAVTAMAAIIMRRRHQPLISLDQLHKSIEGDMSGWRTQGLPVETGQP